MERPAVHIAAEEVVAAYRDLREHPSLHAEQCLEDCIALLSLRLEVHKRRERVVSRMFKPLPTAEKEVGRESHAPPILEEDAV